ncbi:MAG: hypothetical protein K9K38_21995, partial [Rhodoferax sp.]|nr:hypothetical protein [Rhodoferax sp.]
MSTHITGGLASSKQSVLQRVRSLLGQRSAPSGLGLLFILSLAHEISQAQTLDPATLLDNSVDLEEIVQTLRDRYPEIEDQLFEDLQTATLSNDRNTGNPLDADAIAVQITDLETAGYLTHQEALALAKSLKQLNSEFSDAPADTLALQDAGSPELLAQANTGGTAGAAAPASAPAATVVAADVGAASALEAGLLSAAS